MHKSWGVLLAGVLVAVGLVAAGSAAEGQAALRVCGSGYGHGVGLSQWGAYGRAQAGQNYAQIVRAYYRNTRVVQARNNPPVRVLLGSGRFQDVMVRQGRQGRLVNVATGGRVALVPGVYRVRYLPDRNLYRVVNRSAGRAVGSYRGPLVFQPAGGGPLGYGPRNYRGSFVVRASGANVMLVNRLPLELYVRGVVAMEMPASWHQQALRAQAVAVRSFARAALGGGAYDLTTGSMVYGGASGETRATNRAVNATARTYAAYEGRPIPAFFSAANGGYSEASRFVFSPAPYLLAVRDVDGAGRPFERRAGSPWMRWSGTLDNDGSRLGVGTITRVEVTSRTRSGRALEVRVTGTRGARTISGQYDVRNSLRTTGLRLANGSGHPAGALPSARVYFGSQC